MKTMNEIIEQIYCMSECICDDEHEIYLEDKDDEYNNYFLYKNKYEAYEKAINSSSCRWRDYTDDAIYECEFTEEELYLGYYYINKTLYPQAQRVRTKHVRKGII